MMKNDPYDWFCCLVYFTFMARGANNQWFVSALTFIWDLNPKGNISYMKRQYTNENKGNKDTIWWKSLICYNNLNSILLPYNTGNITNIKMTYKISVIYL